MTKQKNLKRAVRARAAKTGESYTAARAQILKRRTKSPSHRRVVSEKMVLENTGKPTAHWLAVLDRFGAPERGHTAAAKHLRDQHGVSGWYSQALTVEYMRARGLRVENQSSTGRFQVSVSRVVRASVPRVASALRSKKQRDAWLAAADPELRKVVSAALGKSGTVKTKPGAVWARFKHDGATVELRADAKPDGRATVVATNVGLQGPAHVERRRAQWKPVLDALRDLVKS